MCRKQRDHSNSDNLDQAIGVSKNKSLFKNYQEPPPNRNFHCLGYRFLIMQPEAGSRTIAASLHLTHPVEGICNQVGESPIQVHRGQTPLVPVPGCNQLGQITVHALRHATDVQLSCKKGKG